jgi:exosortase/archaeosortase family protein
MLVNAFRVFLTGFLVFWVDPKLGEGFMHLSEGWLLFVIAFVILGAFTWMVSRVEHRTLGGSSE